MNSLFRDLKRLICSVNNKRKDGSLTQQVRFIVNVCRDTRAFPTMTNPQNLWRRNTEDLISIHWFLNEYLGHLNSFSVTTCTVLMRWGRELTEKHGHNTGSISHQTFGNYLPKKSVEVSMPHVFKHHGQWLSVRTDSVESHNVLVLEHRQQLRLSLEVLPGGFVGVFESLWPVSAVSKHFLRQEMKSVLKGKCDRGSQRCFVLHLFITHVSVFLFVSSIFLKIFFNRNTQIQIRE